MKGYISIHRKIKNHWLWGDPVKFQWWLTMLMEVNYQEGKMNLGNELISISRGSSTNSLRTWADLFGCGTKAVSNFFKLLEKDNMITREILGKGKHSTTLINITNYSDYQAGEETLTTTLTTTQGQHKGNANGIQSNKGNKGNKGNKEKINTKDVFPFEDFWNKYPKKVAKKKCKDKYKKLKDNQKEKIKDTLDQFLTYKPFADYTHPNPETYLNQERWEDELGTPQTNSSNQVQQTRNFGKSNQVSYGARN